MTYTITREDFITWMERIMDRFDMLTDKLERSERQKNTLDGEPLLDNQDICTMLKMSLRSLQNYRSTGKIKYYKVSGKVFYKVSDIHNFIRENMETEEERRKRKNCRKDI